MPGTSYRASVNLCLAQGSIKQPEEEGVGSHRHTLLSNQGPLATKLQVPRQKEQMWWGQVPGNHRPIEGLTSVALRQQTLQVQGGEAGSGRWGHADTGPAHFLPPTWEPAGGLGPAEPPGAATSMRALAGSRVDGGTRGQRWTGER